jgi:hypothetical protein
MCTPPANLLLSTISSDHLLLSFHKIAFLSALNPTFQQTSGNDKSDLLEKILIAVISAILGGLLVPWLKHIFTSFWTAIQNKFSRKRKFQRDYLNWAIQSNKFISVLPSTMAGVKTGTLHLMEFDEIYISLSVSRGAEESSPRTILLSKRYLILEFVFTDDFQNFPF